MGDFNVLDSDEKKENNFNGMPYSYFCTRLLYNLYLADITVGKSFRKKLRGNRLKQFLL